MSNLSFSQYQEAMKPFFDLIKGYKGAKRMIGEGIEGATAYVQDREPNNPLQKVRSPVYS